MAGSMLGLFDSFIFRQGSPSMNTFALEYGLRLYSDVRSYIGYLPVSVQHLWHGEFNDRRYVEKTTRLRQLKFDPTRDMMQDPATGVLKWTSSANPELVAYMHEDFKTRKEDG